MFVSAQACMRACFFLCHIFFPTKTPCALFVSLKQYLDFPGLYEKSLLVIVDTGKVQTTQTLHYPENTLVWALQNA